MKTTLLISLLVLLLARADAGPPTFETDAVTVALSGRYRYQPPNQKSRRGNVEMRVQFKLRPEDSKFRPSFGNGEYVVDSVTLLLDGKPQKFPAELLKEFGLSTPDTIFFWGDDDPKSILMSGEFTAGPQRRGFIVRIRDGVVTAGPTEDPE